MASQFKLAKETGRRVIKKAAQSAKKETSLSLEGLQRTGVVPTPGGRDTAARERLARVQARQPAAEEEFDPFAVRAPELKPSSIIQPGDPRWVTRPAQEKSGVFNYDYKMPVRESGVQRYNPPRGVPERSQELLARPDVFEKMVAGVERGLPVKDWYEMGPMYKSFIDEFGPDEGNLRFDAFVDAIASTSPRSDVGTNIRNASYWYGQATPKPGANYRPSALDLPEKPTFPYGHLAQDLHRGNIVKTLIEGGSGFDPKKNPKPLSFAWNFRGDPNLVTVDTHAFRAPAMLGEDPRFLETSFLSEKGATPRNIMREHEQGQVTMPQATQRGAFWQSKPKENEYGAWENYYRRIADELGIKPAEAQAAGWVGHGAMTGLESAPKSAMDFVEERILKTARERNMDPADVWREAIRGIRPLTKLDNNIIGDMPGMSAVG